MTDTIKNDDVVSRAVLDPKDFTDEIPARLDLDGHFQLTNNNENKISVNCHRFIKNIPDDVHSLGLAKTKISNENRKAGAIEQTYAGFLQTKVAEVQAIQAEDHRLVVIHSPVKNHATLPDNTAHCDISLVIEPPSPPKKAIKARFIERLIDIFNEDYVAYTAPAKTTKDAS